MTGTILIVDDDIPLTRTLAQILGDGGYHSITAYTAEDGVRLAEEGAPDLVLLDVMIPNMGGWEACRRMRRSSGVPIVFLTALGNSEDIVRGLEIGADDYIVKPFDPSVVLARVKAHLRRLGEPGLTAERLAFAEGALVLDLTRHSVAVAGEDVALTPREFQLLAVLARNAGRVLTAEDLVAQAWGMRDSGAKDNIKPYIHYLRRKIETDPTSPRWLLTVRGVGYRFAEA